MNAEKVFHKFPEFYSPDSELLILGSFPSVRSREEDFYYAHPQNRFWSVLSACLSEDVPGNLQEKKSLLIKHRIALWDVIDSCEIMGSSDSSIKNALPTDICGLLSKTHIKKIILNGRTAEKYYLKFNKDVNAPYAVLPSTSPANAAWSLERLTAAWKKELI